MKITTEKTKSGKVKISADGEYRFSVPAIIWFSSGISEEADVDEEELLSLKKEGDSSFAYETALRLLSMRSHSKKELYMKLKMKYSAEAAVSATEKCEGLGLIDDEKYAEYYARECYERKNWSANRIRAELNSKGIDRDTAENAINALDIDKNTAIINILNKMHLSYPLSDKDRNRAVRRLLSMGYSLSDIRKHLDVEEEW